MAILQPKGTVTPTTGNKQLDEIQTTVVVDVDTPIIKSTDYIGTGNWTIMSYYNQILGISDSSNNLDPQLPTNEQQYDRIDNVVLAVTEGLTVGSLSTLSGTAYVSVFRPHKGDMFTADISANRAALFRVTEVTVKNSALSKVYEISYVLDTTYEVDPNRFAALEAAVTRTFVYDDKALLSMSDQLLLTEDYAVKQKLEEEIIFISENYITEFLNDRGALVSKEGVYDGYATTFFLRIYDGNNAYRVERNASELENTIYDMFLEQRNGMINVIDKLGVVDSSSPIFEYQGRFGAIRTNSVKQIVKGEITPPILNVDTTVLPIAENYLFTNTFMSDLTAGNSVLEKLLYKYVRRDIVDKVEVIKITEAYKTFTSEERYFYTPVILMLYKYVIAKLFSRR